MKRTDTQTLIDAMRILARDIESGDGIANACIAEAADRLEELHTTVLAALSFAVSTLEADAQAKEQTP